MKINFIQTTMHMELACYDFIKVQWK